MYDEDEIETIRRSESDDDGRNPRTSGRLFVAAFTSSLAMVVILLVLVLSGSIAPAATVGKVGGVQIDIGEIRGTNVSLYPSVTETPNCIRTDKSDPNPTDTLDQALPVLAADIGDAKIPGEYQLTLQKDIDLPFGSNAMRVNVQRDKSVAPQSVASRPFYSSYSSPPTGAYSPRGQFIREFNFRPFTPIPNVDDLRESTAVDSETGYRNLTQAKIFGVKGETYEFDLRVRGIDNEDTDVAGDKTYDIEDIGVKAFIDWDQDGTLESTEATSIGFLDADSSSSSDDPNYPTRGIGNLSATVQVPSTAQTGETLMRVVAEVGEKPTDIGSGSSGTPFTFIDNGVVEEYTVAVVEDSADVPEPTQLADTTLKISNLNAGLLDLRAIDDESRFLLDDRFSGQPDPGNFPPVFTSDGELELSATSPSGNAENVRIRNAEGLLHFASFSSLDISFFEAKVSVIDETKANIDRDTCPVLEEGFRPVITDVPDPGTVNPGDTITVDAEIRNPGPNAETQDIFFKIDGSFEDTRTDQTVGAFGTKSYDGTDEPPFQGQVPGTTGIYDVTVDPENDPAVSEEVIVGDPPNFQVTIDSATPDPVEALNASEPLVVDYTITNTGSPNVDDTQRIELLINGRVAEVSDEFVAGSDSVSPTFSTVPQDQDAADPANITVASRDDSDKADVTVYESPDFDVNITNVNTPVDAANESLVVDANITNIGEAEDTQEIKLDLTTGAGNDRTDVDNQTVTLDSTTTADFQNVQLSYDVSPTQDAGPAEVTVRSQDDTDTVDAFIEGEDVFLINNFSVTPSNADPTGDTINADFDLENVGTEQGTQTAVLDIILNDGTVLSNVDDTGPVTLGARQQQTGFTLSNVTTDGYFPQVQARLSTDNDQETRTVNIRQPATFTISDVRVDDGFEVEGGTEPVEIDVTNNGGVTGTADVNLNIQIEGDPNNERTVNSTTGVSVGPGATKTVTLGWQTDGTTPISSSHKPVAEVFNQSSAAPADRQSGPNIQVAAATLSLDDFRVVENTVDVGSAGTNDNTVTAELDISNSAGPNGPTLTANRVEILLDRDNSGGFTVSKNQTNNVDYGPGITTETLTFDVNQDSSAPEQGVAELPVRGVVEDSGGTTSNREDTIGTVNAPYYELSVVAGTPEGTESSSSNRADTNADAMVGLTNANSENSQNYATSLDAGSELEEIEADVKVTNTGDATGGSEDIYIEDGFYNDNTDSSDAPSTGEIAPGESVTVTPFIDDNGAGELEDSNNFPGSTTDPNNISITPLEDDGSIDSPYVQDSGSSEPLDTTRPDGADTFSYGFVKSDAWTDGEFSNGPADLNVVFDITNDAPVDDTAQWAYDVCTSGPDDPVSSVGADECPEFEVADNSGNQVPTTVDNQNGKVYNNIEEDGDTDSGGQTYYTEVGQSGTTKQVGPDPNDIPPGGSCGLSGCSSRSGEAPYYDSQCSHHNAFNGNDNADSFLDIDLEGGDTPNNDFNKLIVELNIDADVDTGIVNLGPC
jgi:hypothetical protein